MRILVPFIMLQCYKTINILPWTVSRTFSPDAFRPRRPNQKRTYIKHHKVFERARFAAQSLCNYPVVYSAWSQNLNFLRFANHRAIVRLGTFGCHHSNRHIAHLRTERLIASVIDRIVKHRKGTFLFKVNCLYSFSHWSLWTNLRVGIHSDECIIHIPGAILDLSWLPTWYGYMDREIWLFFKGSSNHRFGCWWANCIACLLHQWNMFSSKSVSNAKTDIIALSIEYLFAW